MTVHIGEHREDGVTRKLFLLDDELARLVEGFCPFAYPPDNYHSKYGHHDPDARLTITEDGWARCSEGCEYRYPARPPIKNATNWFLENPGWSEGPVSCHMRVREAF